MFLKVLFCFLCVFVTFCTSADDYRLRYEFKYSFKGPNLMQADKSIPFWNHTGDTVPGDEQVRIVPSLRGKKGGVWSKYEFPYDKWEIDLHFRIHGRGKVGADGLVLWLVEKPNQPGPVFGYMDQWKGMGLFFDSFDNDGRSNNPYVYTIVNDGEISYSHATDGIEQKNGGCLRDFRNRPYPVKARLTYLNHVLTLKIDSGNTDVEDYEVCFYAENVMIPKNYYFGITAATGGLADDHDVLKFLVRSLHEKTPDELKDAATEQKLKLQEEYEKNLKEFEKDQASFKEQHPDMAKQEPQGHADDLFEGGTSPELTAIFEVQSEIKRQIMKMVDLMAILEGKQSDIIDKLGSSTTGTMQPVDGINTLDQVKVVQETQKMTFEVVENMKNDVQFLRSTLLTVSQSISQLSALKEVGGNNAGGGGNYESNKQFRAVQQQLDAVENRLVGIQNKQNKPPQLMCPEPEMPSCISMGMFMLVAITQVVAIVLYHTCKSSREDAAKKFF
uniref:Vesicular integral-membrane protein VIP36 n=1 Tax=Phallusia mammillata TaxID=59560 RepID=A0A6F9DK92_9ASCI|nr:vesicular integral-membrane protein VIP36 [Phallusia mammillata]